MPDEKKDPYLTAALSSRNHQHQLDAANYPLVRACPNRRCILKLISLLTYGKVSLWNLEYAPVNARRWWIEGKKTLSLSEEENPQWLPLLRILQGGTVSLCAYSALKVLVTSISPHTIRENIVLLWVLSLHSPFTVGEKDKCGFVSL